MDAVLVRTEGFEDFSWNAIWRSEARIHESGYDVEVAIPFSSLRFPVSTDVQTWGVIIERSYPRNLRYRMRSSAMDRDRTCILCRSNKITGFQGIRPGGTVEIVPTVTAIRTETRPAPGQPFAPTTPNDFGDVDQNLVAFADMAGQELDQLELLLRRLAIG